MKQFVSYGATLMIGIVIGLLFHSITSSNNTHSYVQSLEPEFKSINHNITTKPQSPATSKQEIQISTEPQSFSHFKPETNQAKARSLMMKVVLMDHFPSSGEPNVELITIFEEALELDSQNIDALAQYSNYLVMFNRIEDALPLLKKCVSIAPSNDLCQSNLANYYSQTNNQEQLEIVTKECLSANPSSLMCMNHNAGLHLRKNDPKAALAEYLKIEEQNGTKGTTISSALVYLGIAQSYEMLKQYKQAAQYYRKSCNTGQEYACKWIDQNESI